MPLALTGWQAHDAANYDHDMTVRSAALLREIVSDPARRRAILTDPRDLHRELFAPFTPDGYSEYAGTYRGTPATTLADRRAWSNSQLEPSAQYEFCAPGEVAQRMSLILGQTHTCLAGQTNDDYNNLLGLTYNFCWFGKVHPFLDGNGHVQRALFAAVATEFGYPLSPRFAIHPRPFDRLLAIALEIFTRAPIGKENEELSLAAEYLGFFLDGPFEAPRKHVSTASPYI